MLGEPALPANFAAFPYVNVNAPKGGAVRLASIGTFDSFNPFILRGTAEGHSASSWVTLPGGSGSGSSVGHLWESLLTASADEVATGYGHLAESIETPADKTWVAFNLRPEAKFSDRHASARRGRRVDLPHAHGARPPSDFDSVRGCEGCGGRRRAPGSVQLQNHANRELPLVMGGLPVLPKHFFAGRDFTKPLTDAPIGSGPYRITSFELGRSVTFTRDPKWWAADMPTGRGTNNFDQVSYEYFRDATVAMEAFKAGKVDVRSENIAKNWATAYDFPAVKSGAVIKRDIRTNCPPASKATR